MSEIHDYLDLDHHLIKEKLVSSYLKLGSVNALLSRFPEVPEPTAHRWLDSYDIVKFFGRKPNPLGSVLYFLNSWVKSSLPLEAWYKHHVPSSIKEVVSIPSLHRVVAYICSLTTRLTATGLILTPENNPYQVLVGGDITTPNPSVGKTFGALTIPMTYSTSSESPSTSIKRVLQQETFSSLVLKKQFPEFLIPSNPRSFMNVIVADVNVSVYHLTIPDELFPHLSSPKLENLTFVSLDQIINQDPLSPRVRSGVVEMVTGHLTHIDQNVGEPLTWTFSRLNEQIALVRA